MATKQQLDREIAEALSRRDKPTTWMQVRALHERGEYAGCDTFLLTYLPYHEMEPYASASAYGWGSYEECFDTLELARRRLEQLREEGRIEWAKIYQHDRRYPLQRKLVDEWEDSRQAHSAIKKRASKVQRAARPPRTSHAAKAGQDRVPTIEEIARGMLGRYSSARVAMEMAHWHAMDHAEGSPSRARWLRVRETIDRLSRKDR
jgi:hypothetical protein